MHALAANSGNEGKAACPLAFQPDDAALVAAVLLGDEAARRLLFERHAKRRLDRAEETFVARARRDVVLSGWLEGGARWGSA